MIVETTDPLGTEYALVLPGGTRYTYKSENSFAFGWSIAMWFKYNKWGSVRDRLITLEDPVDSSKDLKVELYNDGVDNQISIGGINVPVYTPTDDWQLLFITTVPGMTNLHWSVNSYVGGYITNTKVPINPIINIGGGIDREFRGDIFDVRVYDKPLATKSGNVLYTDAINNSGDKTVPL